MKYHNHKYPPMTH